MDLPLQVHHVRYLSEGGPSITPNLITLCRVCHARAHSDKKTYQPLLLAYLEDFKPGLTVAQFRRFHAALDRPLRDPDRRPV